MKKSILMLMMLVFTLLSVSVMAEENLDGEWTLSKVLIEDDTAYVEMSREEAGYEMSLKVTGDRFIMDTGDQGMICGTMEKLSDTVFIYTEKSEDNVTEYAFILLDETLNVMNCSDEYTVVLVFVPQNHKASEEKKAAEEEQHTQPNHEAALPPVEDHTCHRCGGLGTVDCPDCRGGQCRACGGAAYSTYYDNRTKSIREKNCSVCHGSGWCASCYGLGTVDCASCGGSGFVW